MRKLGSAVVAASLLVSSMTVALGGTEDQGALAPGNAANVQQAQGMGSDTTMWLVTAAVVAGGICLVLCSGNSNGTTNHTTGGTP
jgi:hypothetical protein